MHFKSLGTMLVAAFFAGLTSVHAQDCAVEAVATLYTDLWGDEISYTISDDNGILVAGQGTADYNAESVSFCIDNVSGCLVLEMYDSFGDGWNGGFLEISLPAFGLPLGVFTLDSGDYGFEVFGEECGDGGGNTDIPVSYTHLTLPTTPYV